MSRPRLALIVGVVLVAAAFLLPCGALADHAGASMPYQDPTADMLQQQAAELAALRQQIVTRLQISSLIGLTGLAGIAYGLWVRRRNRRSIDQPTQP